MLQDEERDSLREGERRETASSTDVIRKIWSPTIRGSCDY